MKPITILLLATALQACATDTVQDLKASAANTEAWKEELLKFKTLK